MAYGSRSPSARSTCTRWRRRDSKPRASRRSIRDVGGPVPMPHPASRWPRTAIPPASTAQSPKPSAGASARGDTQTPPRRRRRCVEPPDAPPQRLPSRVDRGGDPARALQQLRAGLVIAAVRGAVGVADHHDVSIPAASRERCSDRITSSLATAPALRITCASPSRSPSERAGRCAGPCRSPRPSAAPGCGSAAGWGPEWRRARQRGRRVSHAALGPNGAQVNGSGPTRVRRRRARGSAAAGGAGSANSGGAISR